jgi:hypothetical protein
MQTQQSGHDKAERGKKGDEWREMLDQKSGRKYWINLESKQMSWTKPQAAPSEVTSPAGGIGALPVRPASPARPSLCARTSAHPRARAPATLLLRLH